MNNDSEGIATPHEAFCRIVAVNHPQKPDLGHEVKSTYWFREIASDHEDSIACSNALKFLTEKVADGKIRARGIRPQFDAPAPIDLSELRTGVLKVFEGTLECHSGGQGRRLYRDVFLSMADLNRELGATPAKEQLAKAPNGAKINTGRPLKHDWEGAAIATMAWLHAEGIPTQPKPVADEMRRWFTNVGKTDPADSEIALRASRILKAIKDAMKK
jgi:hypothetical protein